MTITISENINDIFELLVLSKQGPKPDINNYYQLSKIFVNSPVIKYNYNTIPEKVNFEFKTSNL